MLVSAIIPVLGDEAHLEALRSQLDGDPRVEVIVAAPPPLGRGAQMNAGARRATGEWLLFLHADSRLADGWLDALQRAVAHHDLIGGWFRFSLDAGAWQARVIERLVDLRVWLFKLPYGDQGFFVRRDVFASLGGYREWPLMEDVDFIRRLRRSGRLVQLPMRLTTSARRWERDGWFRRSTRNLVLVSLYSLGVAPQTLARWYSRR